MIRQRLGGRRDSAAQASGNSPPSSPPPIGTFTCCTYYIFWWYQFDYRFSISICYGLSFGLKHFAKGDKNFNFRHSSYHVMVLFRETFFKINLCTFAKEIVGKDCVLHFF